MSSTSADPKLLVFCTDCGKQLKAPLSWVGKMIKCPGCETHFLVEKKTPQEQAAALPKKKKSASSGSSKFVEDRKGMAELQALGLGIGLAVAGAAISLAIWYAIAMKTQSEMRICSLGVGALVGLGMYVGYRKADAMMGALAAVLAVGVAIAGIFMMYNSFADSVAGSLGATDFKGPRAVVYGRLFAEKADADSAVNLVLGSRREQDKAHRELQKTRPEVAADVTKMSDAEVLAKIREFELPTFTAELTSQYVDEGLKAQNLSRQNAPDAAVDAEEAKAKARIAKMKPEQIEEAYLKAWTPDGREEIAMLLSQIDQAIAIRDKKIAADDSGAKTRLLGTVLDKNRQSVAGLSGFDLYLKKLETEEELSQLELSEVKDIGSKVAGMSLLSPRTAFWLFGVASIAFGCATGGRFNS